MLMYEYSIISYVCKLSIYEGLVGQVTDDKSNS